MNSGESAATALRKFDVTIRRFDPSQDPARGELFVLPVDSPDEEHAAASTLSNAISFSRKTNGSRVLSVAFMVVSVAPRD